MHEVGLPYQEIEETGLETREERLELIRREARDMAELARVTVALGTIKRGDELYEVLRGKAILLSSLVQGLCDEEVDDDV